MKTFLGKQGKYLEADEVKRIADRMEHMELQATLAAYAAEVALKEQALRTKQQNEMEVLLQRAAQGRDDLRKTRTLDLERCQQVRNSLNFVLYSSMIILISQVNYAIYFLLYFGLFLQRHKNIVRELRTVQKQEQLRFENILGKRVSEFKRSGGSFQLLSQTLNGFGSLCLPGIPDCSGGDESSPYGSDSNMSG